MKKPSKLNAAEVLKLDNQLCFSLYSASRAMTQAYEPFLKPLGLTYPQYLAMLVLWEKDQISVSELGERLFLDSGTLSPLLKKLESRGLLKRQRKPSDERTVVIELTKEGQSLKQKAQVVPEKMFCNIDFGISELQEMRTKLHKLRRDLVGEEL